MSEGASILADSDFQKMLLGRLDRMEQKIDALPCSERGAEIAVMKQKQNNHLESHKAHQERKVGNIALGRLIIGIAVFLLAVAQAVVAWVLIGGK